jgi:hypothetical protein
MNNALSMSAAFERQKNTRATIYTGLIAGALLMLFLWLKLSIPQSEQPPVEEFMEVNLGSGDQGFGSDQPELPGEPAPAQQVSYAPPQPVQSTNESVRDISTDERSPDAPAVIKPAVSKPDATKVNAESRTVRSTNTTSAQPVAAAPKPKAVLGRVVGGNGNGGNGAESYKPGGNEGTAGGTGDQGRVGGDPNGRSYTGTPKNFGVKVFSLPNQSFEDDFNENAKVAMDVVVNDNGKVTSASYQPRGSTTSDRRYIDIARRSAFQLKMPSTDGGQKGTVIFNFKVRG